MRNGSSIRKLGAPNSGNSGRKRVSGNIIRAVFLALILLAVGLSALAVHLTAQIGSAEVRASPAVAITPQERGSNNVRSMAASFATAQKKRVEASKAKSDIISPQTNNNIAVKKVLPYPNGPKTDPKYAKDRVYCMVPCK